jgi:hypothetical protein
MRFNRRGLIVSLVLALLATPLAAAKDLSNTIYLDTKDGRVTIDEARLL